jgi:hypothetical protein
MNSKQRSTLKWRLKKAQATQEKIKRTVSGIVYEYPAGIDQDFQQWAAIRRQQNQDYFFDGFYDQLSQELKSLVTVTHTKKEQLFENNRGLSRIVSNPSGGM